MDGGHRQTQAQNTDCSFFLQIYILLFKSSFSRYVSNVSPYFVFRNFLELFVSVQVGRFTLKFFCEDLWEIIFFILEDSVKTVTMKEQKFKKQLEAERKLYEETRLELEKLKTKFDEIDDVTKGSSKYGVRLGVLKCCSIFTMFACV